MAKLYKSLFISLFLLSTSTWCFGQQQPVANTPLPVTTPRITRDTAQAVRTLFSKRRTGGVIWTLIGAAFAGRIIGAGIADGNAGGTVVGVAVLGGVPAGIGISKLSRFSNSKEEEALSEYSKTKKLPRYVSKRLKNKYF